MSSPTVFQAAAAVSRRRLGRVSIAGVLAMSAFVPFCAAQTAPGHRPESTSPIVRLAHFQRDSGRSQIRISLTFSNVDVREVLAKVAEYAHVDVLVTPGASGSISINLRGRLAEDAIRLVAATAGLTVVRLSGSYLVGTPADLKKAVGDFGRREVIALRYISTADAKDILGRMLPMVNVEAGKGAVIIVGFPDDLAAARTALSQVDIQPVRPAPQTDTSVITVRFADAQAAERMLNDALPDLKVVRRDRTLVMTGVVGDLQTAERALKDLDVEPPKEAEVRTVRVYKLKYLNAKKAEESLKKILPQVTIAAAPEPNAPPAASFQPLSTTLFSSSGGQGGGGQGGGGQGGGGQGGGGQGGGGQGGGQGGADVQQLSRATSLILIGSRSDVEMAVQLLDQTDLPQPLVRIEALLVELNTDALHNLGIKWDFAGVSPTFILPAEKGLKFGVLQSTGMSFSAALNALATSKKARILAKPNISAIDNEDANIFIGDLVRFRAGGVLIINGLATLPGTETIPVGIALLVRPRIHPNGDVTLKVHPVVSQITSRDIDNLPQTASREADTTVRLRKGEELVIGGLDREERTKEVQKVPILGDLPFIGNVFRSQSIHTTRTEIVVVIRAYAVEAETAPRRDSWKGSDSK